MNKIVDRDTFLHYLDNADINWEVTARECIAKGFELGDENKKLKEKLDDIEYIISYCVINHIINLSKKLVSVNLIKSAKEKIKI